MDFYFLFNLDERCMSKNSSSHFFGCDAILFIKCSLFFNLILLFFLMDISQMVDWFRIFIFKSQTWCDLWPCVTSVSSEWVIRLWCVGCLLCAWFYQRCMGWMSLNTNLHGLPWWWWWWRLRWLFFFFKKKRNVLPVLVEQNGYFVVLTFKGNK